MPPEWAPHRATWWSWPHNQDTWIDLLPEAERALARAVQALAPGEEVYVNVLSEAHGAHVREVLEEVGMDAATIDARVRLFPFPTNDSWCRDHGGIFVTRDDGAVAVTDWGYNAWGGKYPPWDLDDAIPRRMAEALELPRFEMDMVLEGGSIEVDGTGLCLTTEACLLNPNRNPDLSREAIEQRLRDGLGVDRFLWLEGELEGDDTDGHIDNLARFVAPNTVAAAVCQDPSDPNYEPLRENVARLRAMQGSTGRPLGVLTLPMPAPVLQRGRRMPASYANFYIGNEVVLLPTYDDPADAVAQATLQRLFPNRRVVGIDCRAVIWGLGAFHCLSQQVPSGV